MKMAQVYPFVTSWNGSVIQAERTLATMGIGPAAPAVSESTPMGSRTAELKLARPRASATPLRPAVAKM